ncbi:reverse transcriptase ribonuclease h [Lentinula edodes]|uniref:Reverse transcriptase ribonuclease h n=1 Tax=Lentinula edodes TaxID=5353 RepID=A0A1Q3E306_LENED|nr:reverse transcriptase ribonuclease h [Lentinula edodes]
MASYRTEREEYEGRYPPSSVLTEISWWHNILLIPDFYRELRPKGPLLDLGIFVNASTDWGIGILFGELWMAFHLANDWKIPGRDICWLETAAIELLIYVLEAKGFHDIYILIHSDNQGTIGAMKKACSPNYWINMSMRRTCGVLGPLFIQTELEYIESALNPADPISRGILGPEDKKLPLLFQLPDELSSVITYV